MGNKSEYLWHDVEFSIQLVRDQRQRKKATN